jgi:hypothetical protein
MVTFWTEEKEVMQLAQQIICQATCQALRLAVS